MKLKPSRIALAAALTAMQMGLVHAQDSAASQEPSQPTKVPGTEGAAEPAPAAADNGLNLDRVTVTGTSQRASKMKQSVSISTLDAEQVVKSGATNAAEVLRSVPGVRSESSGGEGNANLTVRGVPISAGGARYVQFQEDGLPLLMFGDIAFGTADQFLRADYNVDRLEVIRGGSASTLATNSPGGIINFISKTGNETGGAMGLSLGLDHRQIRYDFDYGARLSERTRFHFGGFQRVGDGGRAEGLNVENGGQIKGNLTHEIDNGFIRVSFKHLDDRTPSFMPVPVNTVNGQVQTIPGIDPRDAFFITPSLSRDVTVDRNGNTVVSNPRDGLHVTSTAFGVEASLKFGDGWTLDEKFRQSKNSGRFMALFPANNGDGPTPLTATTFTGVLFNTSLDSLDNTINDLRLSKAMAVGSGKLTGMGGLFQSVQDVAQTWYWNRYTVSMQGRGSSAVFLGDGSTTWGGCCVRSWDVQYTNVAPYGALTWESGPLNVDASVRHDIQRAQGWTIEDDGAGVWDPATQQRVSYKVKKTSYSLGANYALSRDLAVFGRASDGVAFSADRLLFNSNAPVDGSSPISVNQVKQYEGGVKWRSGGFSTFLTAFEARTRESNFEATTQQFSSNRYTARGLEVELGYRIGDFRLGGGGTYTKAKITAANDPTVVGKKPRRQADFVFQLSPSYAFGDDLELGASIVGTSKSWGDDANTIEMLAYTVVNAYLNYQLAHNVSVSLSVNNLFDKLGYTEVEGDGHAARSISGRTARAGLKYTF